MASSVSKSRITAIRKTTKTTGMQFTLRRRGMVIPLESLRGLRYKGASSWSPHTLRAAGTEERPRRNAGRRCGNNEAQRRGKSASGFFFFFFDDMFLTTFPRKRSSDMSNAKDPAIIHILSPEEAEFCVNPDKCILTHHRMRELNEAQIISVYASAGIDITEPHPLRKK